MISLEIRELGQEEAPWALLFLADPSSDKVADYINKGKCYLAYSGDQLLGVFVLLETSPGVMEIMNISVAPHAQGKGIGRQHVGVIYTICRPDGANFRFNIKTSINISPLCG